MLDKYSQKENCNVFCRKKEKAPRKPRLVKLTACAAIRHKALTLFAPLG
jgi:hypothetical protein